MHPASRVTDETRCEHGKGEIASPCESSVKAGARASARFADRSRCPAEPDTIREGARTVLIGGLPAARETDATFHSGTIRSGLGSVKVGGPKVSGFQTNSPHFGPGNSFIAFDPDAGRLFIVSYIEYHGPDATPAHADAAKKQIQDVWGGRTEIGGKAVDVKVQVHTKVSSGPPTPGYDRIEVKNGSRSNQHYAGPGTQETRVVGPGDWGAAHEFGHAIGVPDQYMETPRGSAPDPTKTKNLKYNVMAQTWADPDGTAPHTYPEHYEAILKKAGLT